MKKLGMILLWCPALLPLAHAGTITIFDTINTPLSYNTAYTDPVVFPPYWSNIYASFSTPIGDQFLMNDVELALYVDPSATPLSGLAIDLFADASTLPSAQIAFIGAISDSAIQSLVNQDILANPGDAGNDVPVIVDFSTSQLLDPNTRYWIGLIPTCVSDPVCGTVAQWGVANDWSGLGAANEYVYFGGNPVAYANSDTQDFGGAMQMEISDMPEPATFVLGAVGLGLLAVWRRRLAS
ncbi:MAG: PEP-CTERM sorting domain-containing protein [Bryobacteraceae bacterium]